LGRDSRLNYNKIFKPRPVRRLFSALKLLYMPGVYGPNIAFYDPTHMSKRNLIVMAAPPYVPQKRNGAGAGAGAGASGNVTANNM